MEKAKSVSDSVFEWIDVANRWVWQFGDSDQAHHCMSKAEEIASVHVLNWTWLARSWAQDFDDLKRMLYCMDRAENFAGMGRNTYEWGTIAVIWEELGVDARAKDAKTKAEELESSDSYRNRFL